MGEQIVKCVLLLVQYANLSLADLKVHVSELKLQQNYAIHIVAVKNAVPELCKPFHRGP